MRVADAAWVTASTPPLAGDAGDWEAAPLVRLLAAGSIREVPRPLQLAEGCYTECPVEQVRIAKAPAKLALQAADRVEVLRRPRVLVL